MRRSPVDHARLALLVFVAVEVGTFIAVLVLARHQWFTTDDWALLADRKAGSINDLLRPDNIHLYTLPILAYRGLFALFGLRTYLPYQTLQVLLHLTAVALLWKIIRRAGVRPWIATAAASLLALFGAGFQQIIWLGGIGHGGALVFGLTQLLLASHDGPIDRRDWLGLLAAIAGLSCSTLALTMAITVGLMALVRRSWRAALFHTVPVAALYAIWWVHYGGQTTPAHAGLGPVGQMLAWMETGVKNSFEAMGQLPGAAVGLGVLLVVGLALAWGRLDRDRLRTQASAPAALLVGALVFVAMTGWRAGWEKPQFSFSLGLSSGSHYVYLFAALILPALAVAADAIVRRWRPLWLVVLAALVIGIPGNVQLLASPPRIFKPGFQIAYRQFVLSLPTSPVAHAVPRSTLANPYQRFNLLNSHVTIGWLLAQKAAGRLADPGPVSSSTMADATLHLALQQRSSHLATSSTRTSPSPPLVLATKNSRLGTILTDDKGMTLYALYSGTRPLSCTGACRSHWSPLLMPAGTEIPTGGRGVSGLGKSPSGVVTYWGYPLFRYSGDRAAGETNGNTLKASSGAWHIIRLDAPKACSPLVKPVEARLEKGQSIGIEGGPVGIISAGAYGPSHLMQFDPAQGNTLVAQVGPLAMRLQPIAPGEHVTLCR